MTHERIELSDTSTGAIIKLSEGNPGALSVMKEIFVRGPIIDPDALMGPVAHILSLYSFGIYGPRIWMLYKDVCHEDLQSMIAVLRAVQLGKLSQEVMNHAIDNYGKGIDIKAVLDDVQAELPNFGREMVPKVVMEPQSQEGV